MHSATRIHCLASSCALVATAFLLIAPPAARADEGGVSFWAPGLYGSLAAVPGTPGWSFAAVYYRVQVQADGNKAFVRGGRVEAGLDAKVDSVFFGPTYIFAEKFLGAQVAVSLLGVAGRSDIAISATLTGPLGNTISGRREDARTMFGDLYPQATMKWNQGVNNFMTYVTGDIPVGAYDPSRLANLGIGHGAIDGGFGYTYLDPAKGHEFSVVTGLTYNFKNTDTQYQNGVDFHVDWGASHFLSKQVFVGVVGYYYNQLTGDSGSGATLGPFKSRVIGVGPQFGVIFPAAEGVQGFLGIKGYRDFDAQNRPEGWNAWVTLAFSPAAKPVSAPPTARR